jgi:Holliday junction resolvase RusA-like endonuclease
MMRITDVMEVSSQNPLDRTLCFTVLGEPHSQRRVRIAWRRLFARGPRLYDASAAEKAAFRAGLRSAMAEIGVNAVVPYFDQEHPLLLNVKFSFARPNVFQIFPRRKDIDNLVKFVMDASEGVLYTNDSVVTRLVAEKCFVQHQAEEPSTLVRISMRGD